MIESILPVERIDKSQTRAHTERRVEQQNHGHNYVEQIPSVTVTQLYSYALMNSIVLISIPPHPRKKEKRLWYMISISGLAVVFSCGFSVSVTLSCFSRMLGENTVYYTVYTVAPQITVG